MRMAMRSVTLALVALVAMVAGQRETVIDVDGQTVVQSVLTDVNGDPTDTAIVSTITPLAPAQQPGGGIGQGGAAAGAARNTCTTAGCPPAPILYTQNGVEMTFVPTTPPTPSPTFATTGTIVPISQYITTTVSGKAFSGASSRFGQLSIADSPLLFALTTVTSFLVGALYVL